MKFIGIRSLKVSKSKFASNFVDLTGQRFDDNIVLCTTDTPVNVAKSRKIMKRLLLCLLAFTGCLPTATDAKNSNEASFKSPEYVGEV